MTCQGKKTTLQSSSIFLFSSFSIWGGEEVEYMLGTCLMY